MQEMSDFRHLLNFDLFCRKIAKIPIENPRKIAESLFAREFFWTCGLLQSRHQMKTSDETWMSEALIKGVIRSGQEKKSAEQKGGSGNG